MHQNLVQYTAMVARLDLITLIPPYRVANFISKMEGSYNTLVSKVAEMSVICPSSVVQINKILLREDRQNPELTEKVVRTVAQIKELNECLDGQWDCGLETHEIKQILNLISTIELDI